MGNRLRHVAMTYLGNRMLWLLAAVSGWMLLMCFMMDPYNGTSPTQQVSVFVCLGLGMMMAGLGIWGHAKMQFADPRARLTPDFAAPHLVVAWLLSALTIGLWTVDIQLVLRIGPLGALALAAVLFTAAGWIAYSQSWIAQSLFLAIIFGIPTESGQRAFAAAVIAPAAWLMWCGIVTASLAGLVYLGQRMAALTEADGAYHRLAMRRGILSGNAAAAQPKAKFGRFARAMNDARMRLYLARPAGWLQRIDRWRMPVSPMPLWIPIIVMIGVSALLNRGEPQFEVAWMQCGIAAMMPVAAWRMRKPMLAQELLRPVSRKVLLRELGAALAVDTLDTVGMATAFTLVAHAVLRPGRLLESHTWLMMATVWSAATITYGCGAWLLRVRSNVVFMGSMFLALMAVNMVLVLPIALSHIKDMHQYGPLVKCIPLACLVLGLFITSRAYRRWLVTDIN